MKKILSIFTILFLLSSSVQAQTLKAEAMEDFSTVTPSSNFKVKIIEGGYLPDGTVLDIGAIVSGRVADVEHAKRLKRDAYFEFTPNKVTLNGKTTTIEHPMAIAKVVDYEPLDPKQLAAKVAKTAAGYAVKGATQGISFIQGVAQAQNGERLKSGVTQVYKDSPLSYIDEGSELEVKTGDTLTIIIKEIETEE